jgi:hypothetical protein
MTSKYLITFTLATSLATPTPPVEHSVANGRQDMNSDDTGSPQLRMTLMATTRRGFSYVPGENRFYAEMTLAHG